jgi:hypothetical protein
MKRNPRLIATVPAMSLAPGGARANVYTLAVVLQARHANLGSSAVTAGASIFDGDHLSRMLRVHCPCAVAARRSTGAMRLRPCCEAQQREGKTRRPK